MLDGAMMCVADSHRLKYHFRFTHFPTDFKNPDDDRPITLYWASAHAISPRLEITRDLCAVFYGRGGEFIYDMNKESHVVRLVSAIEEAILPL